MPHVEVQYVNVRGACYSHYSDTYKMKAISLFVDKCLLVSYNHYVLCKDTLLLSMNYEYTDMHCIHRFFINIRHVTELYSHYSHLKNESQSPYLWTSAF